MRITRFTIVRASTAVVLLSPGGTALAVDEAATLHEAMATAEADALTYLQHVATLSNPFFEGRGTGTVGNERAQDYIQFHFERLGLAPAFPATATTADGAEVITQNASFRQAFPFDTVAQVRTESLSVTDEGQERSFQPGTDFNVLGFSGNGRVEAPVSFVGYSIEDGPDGYTSYTADADLEGRIALLLRYEPLNDEGRSAFTDGRWSGHAGLREKIMAAVRRNAGGVILVSPPGADDPRTDSLETAESTAGYFRRALEIPVLMISMEAADALLDVVDTEGRSLADLRAVADMGKSGVIDLDGPPIAIEAAIERQPAYSANMGAVLPGQGDLADQYIVIGAHFDHVGKGYQGGRSFQQRGKIHPGADDNASGASGMLLAAERLAAAYAGLPDDASVRSLLFLGFSGEEIGLIGSSHFTRDGGYAPDDMVLMVNMDMIGRLRESLELQGVKTATGLEEMIQPHIDASGLSVALAPGGTGPSDHTNFYEAGVPVLFFFTGLHQEYHTPADVAGLINVEGAVRIVDLMTNIVLDLADNAEPLEYAAAGRSRPHRMPRTGDEDEPAPDRPTRMQIKVRFGISPGMYGDTAAGVLVGDVAPGTSAGEAGVQPNDRLVTWNGVEIQDIGHWMEMLARHEPGDVVQVGIVRDGSEITLPVTLQASDRGPR